MQAQTIDTNTAAKSDQQLWIAATRHDDESAFATLYDRHRPMALWVARGICGEDAEDTVQTAFLSIWSSRHRYQASKGSVRSWMLAIVRNRAIDLVRKPHWNRERAAELTDDIDLIDPVRTDELAAQRETERALRAAVAALPQKQRTVVTLGYFGELSQSEIASRLGLPLGTVKGRARAALESLRPVAAAAAA